MPVLKKAFITGITGQDGSYLTELLLSKGYEVHGLIRRSSTFNTSRLDSVYRPDDPGSKLILHYGDMTDGQSLETLVLKIAPDEIYNLAAQSHVGVSFEIPQYTFDVVASGTLKLLEATRKLSESQEVRFYEASSSEMFGDTKEVPQNEETRFNPCSPYACAKVYAHQQCVNYREAYGMHISCGIMFNHESPRRGETFVTRKITRAIGRILTGTQEWLTLGYTSPKRDWGYAPEYAEAMWLMLQKDLPGDYVIATSETHSIDEFLIHAFNQADLARVWHVKQNSKYFRPAEVNLLKGDYTKAREVLGWSPKTTFKQLIKIMLDADIELAKRELAFRL